MGYVFNLEAAKPNAKQTWAGKCKGGSGATENRRRRCVEGNQLKLWVNAAEE